MHDLLVIGAGLSGLTAAMCAVDAGLTVKVIAKGLGSMHWSAATVDVLGYVGNDGAPVQDPWRAVETLPASHPYRRLGAERVRTAVEAFQARMAALNLPYAGGQTVGGNFLLPSPVGALRPTYAAPTGQRAGDTGQTQPMLVVGFQGMRDFYPKLLAENLVAQGHAGRAVLLPLTVLTDRQDANVVHLAEALDAPSRLNQLAVALKQVVQPGERIGLPAILGLDNHLQVLDSLQQRVEAPVFEIPTLPPSVPGIRLYWAMRRYLESKGVRVEAGMEAVGFHAEGKQVQWVETSTSARPLKHRAGRYLLATGGILGGGFNSDHTGRCWEVFFDLPLTVPQDRRQWFRPHFLDAQGQPVFHGGIAVDENFQPVGPDGEPVYANLWAAGGLLADADPIRERSLEGIAIATGTVALEKMIG